MHLVKLCSTASQWLYNDIHLPLSGMDELIQTTTDVKSGLDRPRFWDFGGEGRSIEMVIAARIFEVSGRTLSCSLAIVIYRLNLPSSWMDGLIQTITGMKVRLYRPRFWDSGGGIET